MENYYSVLEISENASIEEIKKAYARKIRIYSPEKDAENFKRIREAYEVLSNEEKRKEYDFQIKHGTRYQEDLTEAERLIEIKQYNSARDILKRLTLIKPEDERLWIRISDTYIGEGKLNDAIEVLKKGLNYNNESSLILFLLGLYYKEMKEYYLAEEYLKKALKIDKNYYIYEQLLLTYLLSKKYYYIETLLKELENNSYTEFEKIKYNLLAIKSNYAMAKSVDDCLKNTKKYKDSIINICQQNNEAKLVAIKLILEEIEFYHKEESVLGLYICWEMLYKLTPDSDEAKENYYALQNILFSNTSSSNTNAINTNKNTEKNNYNSTTQSSSSKNISNESNKDSEGCLGFLGWLFLFGILIELGPVGIIIFFIILYYAKK